MSGHRQGVGVFIPGGVSDLVIIIPSWWFSRHEMKGMLQLGMVDL